MNISLTQSLKNKIEEQVESGLYNSASEVVRDALRLFFEHDELKKARIRQLNKDIEVGLKDIEEGKVHDLDSTLEELKKRYE
ncbi:MAG: type II toxin-antitoxin system ParD family antitoxin [Candidatus Omnitrophota bacterium]